ncbi:OprO/OprP family phosphate-selective porin [Thermomonas sp.]|uniref:OprO/OprP family phosphate-selective porin n=1 Tax=Thermomonas sp. TaxID=1971895 RepID=UPI0035B4CFA6
MQRKTLALAVTLALAATSFSASAQDSRDAEIAALKQQLMDLVAKVQELESRTDAQSEVNVDTATQLDNLSNNVAKVETKGGIKVTSADKNFEASLGGRIHFDAYSFDSDVAATTDTTEFRRARLTLSGKAFGWEYKVENDFAAGSNLDGFRDLYIAKNMLGGKVTIGHFKPYRSMEELTSSNEILLMERPSTSATGIYSGRQFQQGVGYLKAGSNYTFGVSAFNMRSAPTARTEGAGISGRATWAPIDSGTTTLHLGGSYSHENLNKGTPSVSAVSNYAGRRGPSLTMATTSAAVGVNDSQVDTFGLEAAFRNGPFFVQSEYARASFGQANGSSQDVDAFYVQGSFMLNGGLKAYKGATGVFGSPVVPADKGLWELVARYDVMENKDLLDTKTTSALLGVNYYINPNLRMMLNWTQGKNDKTGDEPSQVALRTQFAF